MTFATSLIVFLTALGVGLAANPLAMRLAKRYGIVDNPGHRKIHKKTMPKLGGLAIVFSLLVAAAIGFSINGFSVFDDYVANKKLMYILGATLAAGVLGLFDDIFDMKPRVKFAWQILLATSFAWFGFRFEYFHIPGFQPYALGWLAIPLTVLWITAVINGFNFMDGIDGLAASVTAVSLAGLWFISFLVQGPTLGVLCPAALGAVAAFLVFNWRPARIYLGDSGAYALGMFLATSLTTLGYGSRYNPAAQGFIDVELRFHFLVATLLVCYPMLEVVLSTVRRGIKKFVMGRSMEWSEKEHIHHRLLKLKVGPRLICRAAIVFEVLAVSAAILVLHGENARAVMALLPIIVLLSSVMPRMGFFDFMDPKAIAHSKPHFQIAHSFIEMQRAKLELAQNREEVLSLVSQTCNEFGVRSYHLIIPADTEGRGGLDFTHEWEKTSQMNLGFLSASDKPATLVFSDQYRLSHHRGGAQWVFEPHTEEGDLDVEYRVLVHDFMKAAMETISRMGEGRHTLETSTVGSSAHKALSGNDLRKRHHKGGKAV